MWSAVMADIDIGMCKLIWKTRLKMFGTVMMNWRKMLCSHCSAAWKRGGL